MGDLQAALTEAMELMNKPRFHSILIERAGVDLDRALFPLLMRIGAVDSYDNRSSARKA